MFFIIFISHCVNQKRTTQAIATAGHRRHHSRFAISTVMVCVITRYRVCAYNIIVCMSMSRGVHL